MTTVLEGSEEMVGKQVRGKYTQEYKAEAVRQAEASQSLAVLCWSNSRHCACTAWPARGPIWSSKAAARGRCGHEVLALADRASAAGRRHGPCDALGQPLDARSDQSHLQSYGVLVSLATSFAASLQALTSAS